VPLAVRCGLSRQFPATGLSTDQRLSVGFGLGFQDLVLDYAFLPWGDFGATNRLSLHWLQRWQPGHDAGPAPEPSAETRTALAVNQLPLPEPLTETAGAPAPSLASPSAQTSLHVLSDLAAQGRSLQEQGRNNEALQAYLTAVHADSGDLEAWRGLARLYHSLGQEAEARRCWQRVRSLDPEDPEAAAVLPVP
jgi:tetratricopeptide (TPR) repeat protein